MIRRAIRLFVIMPLLGSLWAYANSIGATQYFTRMTGIDIPSGFTIPGVGEAMSFRDNVRDQATEQARKTAMAVVRKEVERRYGPQAADTIPADLTVEQLKHFDYSGFKAAFDKYKGNTTQIAAVSGGQKPTVPYMSAKAYRTALATLATLPIKGKSPKTGYSRERFGTAWTDAAGTTKWAHNGLDTRNDMLSRDLIDITCKPGTKSKTGSCKVLKGTLPYDPYNGETSERFDITNGGTSSLDAEHVVALGAAWVTGASSWTADKRAAYANDPTVLMSVNAHDNRAKGDADFATWLPPNKAYRAAYAARQIAIKKTWGLWVTRAEHDAMEKVLRVATN